MSDRDRFKYVMGQRGGRKSWWLRLVLEQQLADGITVAVCRPDGAFRARRVQRAPFVLDLYERLETPEWALKN